MEQGELSIIVVELEPERVVAALRDDRQCEGVAETLCLPFGTAAPMALGALLLRYHPQLKAAIELRPNAPLLPYILTDR